MRTFPGNHAKGSVRCFRCNQAGHKSSDTNCPAKDKTCRKCGLMGHFAVVCITKAGKNVNRSHHVKQMTEEPGTDFLFSTKEQNEGKTGVSATCAVGGIPVDFLIDSGSTINIVNRRTWEHLKSKKLRCKMWTSSGTIKAYGGHSVSIVGRFSAVISHKNASSQAEFAVFDGDAPSILSCETSLELNLISFNVNCVTVDENKPISGFKANIPVTEIHSLPFHKARPVPYGLLDAVKQRLEEMETQGIITKVESASNATPIVVVQKKGNDGKTGECVSAATTKFPSISS